MIVEGTDIGFVWDPVLMRGDWSTSNGDLTLGNPLLSAVYISLFTDRVKSPDFVLNDGTTDPRGWWADAYETSPIGSHFWEFERIKIADRRALILRAQGYGNECLQWLIDDGVVASVVTTAYFPRPDYIAIDILLTKPDSAQVNFRFAWAWKGVA